MKRCTKRKITGNTLTRNTVNSPMAALFVHKHERNGEKEGVVNSSHRFRRLELGFLECRGFILDAHWMRQLGHVLVALNHACSFRCKQEP